MKNVAIVVLNLIAAALLFNALQDLPEEEKPQPAELQGALIASPPAESSTAESPELKWRDVEWNDGDELPLEALLVPGYDPPELRSTPGLFDRSFFPDAVQRLDGRPFRIQGYALAIGSRVGQSERFLVCRFPPGCCFGAIPVPDEWIDVMVENPPDIPAGEDVMVEVVGTLEVGELLDEQGFAVSLYRMQAERVRRL